MKRISQCFFVILLLASFISKAINYSDEILIISPEKVVAGNDFLLSISIPEGYIHGVARLQIDLPDGFTATEKLTENADFKFENQKATFQWLSFPENREVTVKMAVSTVSSLEGYFVIRGIANWIENSESQRADINPAVITIIQNENLKELQVQNELTKITYEHFESDGVACIRQVPYEKDNEIFVNILVSKGELNKFGKIQETIPPGYIVKNVKSKNAIFVSNEQQHTVKYMWMNMPSQSKFIVTYKLIPTEKVKDNTPFFIYGTFYYAENNKTETVDIKEMGIDLIDQ